ncbi:two-component system sensory kinase [Fragilariopsis cylindrus CCMP1102]|uniref:histidine kinase n=1 Tax=Fragilariopsis cylindrus CCMP1102 TaxID=635003 RepID=A0A1E7F9N7_9STRA|nr:two-component system sensory kinase [Fragilariopsis cylindrus CCMP1102]|eukprot:OEU14849.1 two-component system sensory kinase [Fragilariopsis cylindrus CCMP1102]
MGETSNPNDRDISIPTIACIGTVLIMLFTSILFISYDSCVRKEFDSKERLLEAKRRFVRYISHEVRTPLNTVCMGLTLVLNDLSDVLDNKIGNDDVVVLKRKYVEEWMSLSTQVYQNADAAVGVLSDLLNYDKIQMGTLTLELSLMNIWSALEKTVTEFKLTAIEKDVNLKLDFTPLLFSLKRIGNNIAMIDSDLAAVDLPIDIRNYKVVGDKIRLIQVFRNLISNGLKFSKQHSNMTVRVSLKDTIPERKQKLQTVSLHKNNTAKVTKIGLVSIEVIDDGVGMTPDQVATVFDDGTQFDTNKFQAGGGSGLGLNIARGIVLEHGATLTCSSKGIGKGSIFTLSTAIYTDSLSTSQEETERCSSTLQITADRISNGMLVKDHMCDVENPIEATEFEIPNLHVLVVDDSVTNRKLCMRLLERKGHTTEGASDGQEAVNMVKKSLEIGDYYDCILLDYEMPVMNGPDACRKIREMGCSSYIAGVTGNVMSEDVDHFRQCGANWVLPKPFRLKALEDQWVEDGLEAFTKAEKSGNGMVRVESSNTLIKMGDNLAQTLKLKSSSSSPSSYPPPPSDSSV